MFRTALSSQAWACWMVIALFLSPGGSAYADDEPNEIGLAFEHSEPAPDLNARFRSQRGWIGGDTAQSVSLGQGKTLWLFGDTWVGAVKDGRRSRARLVHNSVGIQDSSQTPCRYVIAEGASEKPVEFFSPADGRGWLWPLSGVLVRDRLYLFLAQYERSENPRSPEHSLIGQWLGIVENPHDDPQDWCLTQTPIPFSITQPTRTLSYGSNAVVAGEHLYIYGCDDRSKERTLGVYLTVARVPLDHVENMSQWRFFRKGRWSHDSASATHISDYMAAELSVARLPNSDQYVMVYTDCGVSNRVVARTAPTPVGPWSDIKLIHTCTDAKRDTGVFSYAAKAHPTLSDDGRLVISYLTSSADPWQVATDARLFWPTFVTVDFRDNRPASSVGTVAGRSGRAVADDGGE
jgi:hypothetical protein